MKDRWVLVFAVFCLAQLPLYVYLGRGPLGYDTSMKSAETRMVKPLRTVAEFDAVASHLDSSQVALDQIPAADSRRARLSLDRALLAWHRGQVSQADSDFRAALQGFEASHGPDAFHTSVVNLRYAEFLMQSNRYPEALARFDLGVKAVEDTMGPKNPFAVRMVFRRVTLLCYLGRYDEARQQADGYLNALLEQAGKFDVGYLEQTAPMLDSLTLKAAMAAAPGGGGWRAALMKAHEEGQSQLTGSADEG